MFGNLSPSFLSRREILKESLREASPLLYKAVPLPLKKVFTPYSTITIKNISQVIVFVNTLTNIFLRIYLTTYIYLDILIMVCIKKRKSYGYFTVSDVGMNGFPVTLIKNRVSAPIQSVIVRIGKNPENGENLISNFLITITKFLIRPIDKYWVLE